MGFSKRLSFSLLTVFSLWHIHMRSDFASPTIPKAVRCSSSVQLCHVALLHTRVLATKCAWEHISPKKYGESFLVRWALKLDVCIPPSYLLAFKRNWLLKQLTANISQLDSNQVRASCTCLLWSRWNGGTGAPSLLVLPVSAPAEAEGIWGPGHTQILQGVSQQAFNSAQEI